LIYEILQNYEDFRNACNRDLDEISSVWCRQEVWIVTFLMQNV
jgi:hypothetical protein